jgi:hypothetical protein
MYSWAVSDETIVNMPMTLFHRCQCILVQTGAHQSQAIQPANLQHKSEYHNAFDRPSTGSCTRTSNQKRARLAAAAVTASLVRNDINQNPAQ